MISVKFYKFTKMLNSLKRPTDATTSRTYQCLLREPTSIVNPVLELMGRRNSDQIIGDDIYTFNYVYIDKFKRYYFVNDVVYTNNRWVFTLDVDVLASYYNDIINSRQYVTRSASQYNSDIIDNIYPTIPSNITAYQSNTIVGSVEQKNLTSGNWESSNFFNKNLSTGYVSLGVVSSNYSGVNYYVMPVNSFNTFIQKAFTIVPPDMTDVATGTAQVLYNPLQYIVSCIWFPTSVALGTSATMVRTIKLGTIDVNFGFSDTFCYAVTSGTIANFRCYIRVPRHPDASTSAYMKYSPYSKYNLYFQPFGDIPLDTTKINGCARIVCEWDVDVTQGDSILRIYNEDNNGLIYNTNGALGVTLPLSSMRISPVAGSLMLMSSYVGNLFSDLNSSTRHLNSLSMKRKTFLTFADLSSDQTDDTFTSSRGVSHSGHSGSWEPEYNSLTSQFADFIGASLGQVQTKGSPSSFLGYGEKPYLYAWFVRQAPRDITRLGAPLYANVRLDNLSGYCICLKPTITFSGYPTDNEIGLIMSYLESGIYIE